MATEVIFGAPDPGTCPEDFVALVAELSALLLVTDDETSLSYVVQAATPSVGQQGLIWFKLDGGGRPTGVYKFYDGNWRRVYNGMTSQVTMFTGDPTGLFDGTGKGILGTEWDGWALMNGQNGTVDISDKFIVAGHMNNASAVTGYSGGWRTTAAGAAAATGGVPTFSIVNANLPLMDINITGNRKDSSGANLTPLKVIIDDDYMVGAGMENTLDVVEFGQAVPTPIGPVLPPFYAMAFCKFIGYA